jgi:hypothetical protein
MNMTDFSENQCHNIINPVKKQQHLYSINTSKNSYQGLIDVTCPSLTSCLHQVPHIQYL